MNISEAARATGMSAKMIRYYEKIGVVEPAMRQGNGYRHYASRNIHTLRFVQRARNLGFTIKQIRELVRLWQDQQRSSAEVKHIARAHVAELEEKIQAMEAMRRTLKELADHCHGDERPECPILEDLADPTPSPTSYAGTPTKFPENLP